MKHRIHVVLCYIIKRERRITFFSIVLSPKPSDKTHLPCLSCGFTFLLTRHWVPQGTQFEKLCSNGNPWFHYRGNCLTKGHTVGRKYTDKICGAVPREMIGFQTLTVSINSFHHSIHSVHCDTVSQSHGDQMGRALQIPVEGKATLNTTFSTCDSHCSWLPFQQTVRLEGKCLLDAPGNTLICLPWGFCPVFFLHLVIPYVVLKAVSNPFWEWGRAYINTRH